MTINEFKRGFGRHSYPLKRWLWFASPAVEIKYLEDQLKAYKENILN